jgi:AcrR family transcriptional regulator
MALTKLQLDHHAAPKSSPSTAPELQRADSQIGRRDRTRQALIEAGEKLMTGGLLSNVSIDEIVAEAKTAKGTFYNHFLDKDDLFNAVVAWVRGELRSSILEQTADLDDPARRIARAFCVSLRYQLEHRRRALFLAHSRFLANSVSDQLNIGIVGFVSDGIARGRFLLPTVEAGVLLIHGLSHAVFAQSAHDVEAFGAISRAQQLGALLLRGLGLSLVESDQISAQETNIILRPHFENAAAAIGLTTRG